jgi:D-aspartate ligase
MNRKSVNPGAVIIGGSFHSLGAARNLAKHGVPVCILDSEVCISRFSRRVKLFLGCPSMDDEACFIEFLLRIASERNMEDWVLFPSTDDSVRIISQYHKCISEHYRVAIPPWETVRFLYDKRLTHRLAEEREVSVPKTHNPRDVGELVSLSMDFPVVLKPAISKHFMAVTKKKAYRANDKEELVSLYENTAEIIDQSEILIQDLIPSRLRVCQPDGCVNTRWSLAEPAPMSRL